MRYAFIENGYVSAVISGCNPGIGWIPYPDNAPEPASQRIRYINGSFIAEATDIDSFMQYDLKRIKKYPCIGDQLDALWKLLAPMVANNPEAQAIYDQIQQVKSSIPKQ